MAFLLDTVLVGSYFTYTSLTECAGEYCFSVHFVEDFEIVEYSFSWKARETAYLSLVIFFVWRTFNCLVAVKL